MNLKEYPALKKAVLDRWRLMELEKAVREYSDNWSFTVRKQLHQKKLGWALVFTDEIAARGSVVYRPDEVCPTLIRVYG